MSTETDIHSQLLADGYTLTASEPVGAVDDDWPHIAYAVQLLRNGKLIWSGPYKIGIGHVSIPKCVRFSLSYRLTPGEESILMHLQSRPHSKFNTKGEAHRLSLLAKLAKFQKGQPKLADVVHSLVSDGSCYLDSQTFENWADDFGYSSDSIKARDTFNECNKTGRQLVRALGRDEVNRLRDLLSDY